MADAASNTFAPGWRVRRHAVGWLVAANLIGLWLALQLAWPAAGRIAGPLTYGRWVPLHLDWQLYGWCSLPLVGALLAWCGERRHGKLDTHVSAALWAWTLALVIGAVSWLQGVTDGKPFLDWHGWARPVLPIAMLVLWTVAAAHANWRLAGRATLDDWLRMGALLMLVLVPGLLYWAAGRDVYPSVNPDSGGATGASLLGSTLGIVAIYGMLPRMLGVTAHRNGAWYWWALAGSMGVFALSDHGNASHHLVGQIAALGLLIAWVPLAWIYFRGFGWRPQTRPWLAAAFSWWLLLVATGFLTFLPGFSERLKFTDGLVAHAHLAMAGMVTSMNFAILQQLDPRSERRGLFWLWQLGCLAHVGVLMLAGWHERDDAAELFANTGWASAAGWVRFAAGVAMLVASLGWLRQAWSKTEPQPL